MADANTPQFYAGMAATVACAVTILDTTHAQCLAPDLKRRWVEVERKAAKLADDLTLLALRRPES